MRRSCLLPLAAALLLALGGLGAPARTVAQEATPATAAAAAVAVPAPLDAWAAAFEAGDGATLAALYAEDGVHEDVPSGTVAVGRDQIAAFVDGFADMLTDIQLEPSAAHLSEDWAVLEYTAGATDIESGQRVTPRGLIVFELEDGLIARSADYYDVAGILAQLGLLDPGGMAAPGATPAP
jgi:steroid delta-isomerase-like uncharacterized protein